MRPIMVELQKSLRASSPFSLVLLLVLLWLNITVRPSMAATKTVPVGVILDLNSRLGKMVNNSLALAVENYYLVHNNTATKITLVVWNVSQDNIIIAANRAYRLMHDVKVRALLGPQNSEQARYIVRLGEQLQVPVIWFPITGPSLLPPPSPSSIYIGQGLNCYQFQAIAASLKALGWQSIVPIYEETEYGSHLVPCLTNVLKEMGIRMANVTAIASNSSDRDIDDILLKLNNMRTHVFLVHMSMDLGTTFVLSAQRKEMMGEGYAWILTQELSSLTDPQVTVTRNLYTGQVLSGSFTDFFALKRYMQGALGVRPMDSNKTDARKGIENNFTAKFGGASLTIYGWWAYHTIEALAMALEKPGADNNGTKLRSEILATNFTGVSGINFNLKGGQLDQSVLEVYNVVGTRERIIGSWNPKDGFVQNNSKSGEVSGDGYQLSGPLALWPGDTLDKPPKLRIGVPRTNSFPEFVNVDNSSKLLIDGFAINVFLKAIGVLPFLLNNYEFVLLPNKNASDTPTNYDDLLCSQMKDEDLDAIIGDIAIVTKRTNCVDFTLPYLDSSVAMVVRAKAYRSKGILFKPFDWSLWLILGGIFVGATIIIIMLERNKTNEKDKTNEEDKTKEFRSNPFLVYKMDAMEFKSKSAGWMVILTSLLFILVVQVYTANLTSILTQGEKKKPEFKDENEVKSSNVFVGHRNGSWVKGLLINQMGFDPSRLKPLATREEYNLSLSNGIVGAIFDETPYLTLFLSRYRSGFMMAGPIHKTGGLAFAFPKKSSLALHFSNAILKVTQDAEPYRVLMARSSLPTSIEDLIFEDQSDTETTSLKIDNFGGLYPS
ncbi:glutamate receptor 2.7 [Neltuma alba]|uniref:glutamate receptor 2.7 n=1 Tax=Neltuma alba TaxID=207710 RepID=UPI0010A3A745|nr:glutamate receptor 2.7-like [Prosopis alba]